MNQVSASFALVAEQQLIKGQYEEAIATCEEGLSLYPNYPSAMCILAKAYYCAENYAAAQSMINIALERFPTNIGIIKTGKAISEFTLNKEDINNIESNYTPNNDSVDVVEDNVEDDNIENYDKDEDYQDITNSYEEVETTVDVNVEEVVELETEHRTEETLEEDEPQANVADQFDGSDMVEHLIEIEKLTDTLREIDKTNKIYEELDNVDLNVKDENRLDPDNDEFLDYKIDGMFDNLDGDSVESIKSNVFEDETSEISDDTVLISDESSIIDGESVATQDEFVTNEQLLDDVALEFNIDDNDNEMIKDIVDDFEDNSEITRVGEDTFFPEYACQESIASSVSLAEDEDIVDGDLSETDYIGEIKSNPFTIDDSLPKKIITELYRIDLEFPRMELDFDSDEITIDRIDNIVEQYNDPVGYSELSESDNIGELDINSDLSHSDSIDTENVYSGIDSGSDYDVDSVEGHVDSNNIIDEKTQDFLNIAKGLENAKIAPIIEDNLDEEESETPLVASETMAKIFAKQKAFDKAIKVYQMLIASKPENTDYYSEKIEQLNCEKLEID